MMDCGDWCGKAFAARAVGIAVRKRAQQDGVGDAKDGCTRANGEGDGEYRGDGEYGSLAETAQGVDKVAQGHKLFQV